MREELRSACNCLESKNTQEVQTFISSVWEKKRHLFSDSCILKSCRDIKRYLGCNPEPAERLEPNNWCINSLTLSQKRIYSVRRSAFAGAEASLPSRKQTAAAEQHCGTQLRKQKMEAELLRLLSYGSFLYYSSAFPG